MNAALAAIALVIRRLFHHRLCLGAIHSPADRDRSVRHQPVERRRSWGNTPCRHLGAWSISPHSAHGGNAYRRFFGRYGNRPPPARPNGPSLVAQKQIKLRKSKQAGAATKNELDVYAEFRSFGYRLPPLLHFTGPHSQVIHVTPEPSLSPAFAAGT